MQLHSFEAAVGAVMYVLDGERVFHAAGLDHDKTYAAFGKAFVIGDHAGADSLVLFHEGGAIRRFDNAVPRLNRANHPRFHESVELLCSNAHFVTPRL
jgi:hypothetical protein